MLDLFRWGAELRDTAAELIADSKRTRERASLLVKETDERRAALKALGAGLFRAVPPGEPMR